MFLSYRRLPLRFAVAIIIALFLFLALSWQSPAFAQVDPDQAVSGQLRYNDADGERVPAPGVSVEVTDSTGASIGVAISDIEGTWLFPVPSPGSYTATLDPETLPEGVTLAEPDRTTAELTVDPGQTSRAIFGLQLGDGPADSSDLGRRVAQLTVEGLKLGLFLAMAAIGLSLIFGTTGLTNFAHSEMIGMGMLTAYFFNFYGLAGVFGFMSSLPPPFGGGVNLIIAILISTVLGGAFGWFLDAVIFARLRRRGVSLIAQMVVTIGLSILIRYIFLFVFGGVPRFYKDYTAQAGIAIGPISITPKDLISAGISLAVLIGVGIFLNSTKMGKAMRAVSDNRDLAESSGIAVQKVIRFVWVSGGALAALGGSFIGLSEQVAWNTGFRILLLIFAGVVLGGLGTAYGALVGSLLVGIGIQISTIFIATELKNVGALAVLILVLVIRPQGILGTAERVG